MPVAELDHPDLDGDELTLFLALEEVAESLRNAESGRVGRVKHLPGEHNQQSHGGVVSNLMTIDDYFRNYPNVLDERATDSGLTAIAMSNGDTQLVMDDPHDLDHRLVLRDMSSDEMRDLANALQSAVDGEPGDDGVNVGDDVFFGLTDSGDVNIQFDDSDQVLFNDDIGEDDALALIEALRDMADAADEAAEGDDDNGGEDKAARGYGMRTKHFGHVEIKDAAKGEVSAVIATLDEVDSDGDAYEYGAFDINEMAISPWGHKVWDGGLPVGSGRIDEVGNEAIFTGQFFLDTTDGADHFRTIKRLHDKGINVEWSYGYDVLDEGPGGITRKGKTARRVIRKLAVHEVSPLLKGAGVNTRTLSAKSGRPTGRRAPLGGAVVLYRSAIRPHKAATYSDPWDATAAVATIAGEASVDQLRSIFAWVDSAQDPETKAAYRLPHHATVDGPASIRACVAGIAALNGGRGGMPIPDDDRTGVYEHLAAHLRDADREPPELRATSGGAKSINDILADTLVEVTAALDLAEAWARRRTEQKGKGLTRVNAELLDWLGDDLARLRQMAGSPEEDLLREFVRYQARVDRLRTL